MRRIIKKASVEPWQRLWQTLRQSCEKEWAMTLPQYAVSKWIGHSITVSGRHYANDVPDELYTKAADGAQRPAQQKAHETDGNARKTKQAAAKSDGLSSRDCSGFPQSSAHCTDEKEWSRGESNPRAGTVSKPRLRV